MNKEKFAKIVKNFHKDKNHLVLELATEFEVARSTVVRWAKGVAIPAPRIRAMIVDAIERITNAAVG